MSVPATTVTGFAVLDLETTGLYPKTGARIVEIGVVFLDAAGATVSHWETLVDPERDPGPTEIHGVTSAMLERAPTFAAIAGNLASSLEGRVLVAHNAKFDVGFLDAEFARAGVGWSREPLCTLKLARRRGLPLSLAACCGAFGIVNHDAHRALGDAVATAELLLRLDCRPGEMPGGVTFPDGWPDPADQALLRPRHSDAGTSGEPGPAGTGTLAEVVQLPLGL